MNSRQKERFLKKVEKSKSRPLGKPVKAPNLSLRQRGSGYCLRRRKNWLWFPAVMVTVWTWFVTPELRKGRLLVQLGVLKLSVASN